MQSIRYLILLNVCYVSPLWAVCATLIKGPIAIDVQQCTQVQPEKAFPLTDSKYNFIRDLPPANRQVFLDTYRGLLIKGTVARSLAVRTGLSPEKGALQGELIAAFIEPKVLSCAAIEGKRLQAQVDEVCCEGGGEAPCLLGSSYMLKRVELTKVQRGQDQPGHRRAEVRAVYQQALAAINRREFKIAIASLEKLRSQTKLDAQGEYLLAHSLRESDRCAAALPLLEQIYRRMEGGDYWRDDEIYVRRGTFLFARCLALLSRPGEAVIILQSFLVEPKKYGKEIRDSFVHPDFGGIRTDKQFLIYRQRASQALSL